MDAHCVGKSIFWGKTVDDIKVTAVKRPHSLDRRGSSPSLRAQDKKRFYLGWSRSFVFHSESAFTW